MGAAKRNGTFEERKAKAIARDKALANQRAEQCKQSVAINNRVAMVGQRPISHLALAISLSTALNRR